MDAALKAKITAAGYRPDPVTTEIVRNGLIAATEEMKTNLMRTAYNMIIYEALDFTVGLFDAEGNTLPPFELCLETVRDLAAALGKLCHDLLVQPDVHFRRAIESAGVAEFLRQLLAGAKAAVQFQ